jgi:hypothetical protein
MYMHAADILCRVALSRPPGATVRITAVTPRDAHFVDHRGGDVIRDPFLPTIDHARLWFTNRW